MAANPFAAVLHRYPSGRASLARGDCEINLSSAVAHVNRLHCSTAFRRALLRRAGLAASASNGPSPVPEYGTYGL